ncbi:MAG: DUF885 family protein [Acidobacteriota bacterium]
MRVTILVVLAAGCMILACAGPSGPDDPDSSTVAGASAAGGAGEKLNKLVEDYFEEWLKLNPILATFNGDNRFNDRFANTIGPAYREEALAMQKRYLAAVRRIDPSRLAGQDLLTYETFERGRREAIEADRYPSFLLPVNQFFSVPNLFAQMGSGRGIQPFKTVKDYEDFLARVDGFVTWMDQAITNMREGAERGIVQPRILMERTLPQLAAQVRDDPRESLFFGPIRRFPAGFSKADRARLTGAYTGAITAKIVPAYRRLHDFIRDEYLPHTRETVGMNALPDGDAWYVFLVKRTTTTELTPEQIHQIGLREVDRIHAEMEKIRQAVGFRGDLHAFFDHLNSAPEFYFARKEDLLKGYRDLREDIEHKSLALFKALPRADFEIRAVEPFRERSSSGASYRSATPDGSRPGVFFVNTYDLKARPKWAMESLFLHEAVPGHHFQISTQRELENLPRFRRFGGYTAYSEGWGLYAESLGRELGVYQDPYQYFGALAAELWRAIRLVVDTGLHHEGWTRQQVLDYMYANTAVKQARAVSEAERYIAIPGQALAYKIGQLKISELRALAQRELGDRFDVREFHDQVLEVGALPLDVLEQKIAAWIKGF